MEDQLTRLLRSLRAGSFRTDLTAAWRSYRLSRRTLSADPSDAAGTPSARRITRFAHLIDRPRAYLEVGVEHGFTLEAIPISRRVAVDPRPLFSAHILPPGVSVFATTSDAFFAQLEPDERFDLVFLDGLHTFEQTYRDLINSLRHLQPRGVIVIDDVVPVDAYSALRDSGEFRAERARRRLPHAQWHGDVFRLIPLLTECHPELHIRTIVGSGNEQTVVVRRLSGDGSHAIDDADLSRYRELAYSDLFADGIPDSFLPGTEDEVLEDVAAIIGGLTT